ncbi:MAG TPA: hypothetical protein VNV85_12215, partial [Puia sp.]|nr:hypothetical protein [Puia sp.]
MQRSADIGSPAGNSKVEGLFAEIIIPLALPKNYTWVIPERFADAAKLGCRVEVVLKNRKYAGVIKRIHNEKPGAFDPKEILNMLDTEPVVYLEQLQLWEWIANYYLCSEGEVMAAALPAHLKLSSETILIFNEEYGEDFSELSRDEYIIAEALLIKKELKLTEAQQLLDSSHVYPVTKKLIEKKVCFVWEELKQTYIPKKEVYVVLNSAYDDEDNLSRLLNEDKKLQRAEKQMELLLSYLHLMKTQGEVTKSELLKKSGATDTQLKGLTEKNILKIEKRNVDRLKYLPRNILIDSALSAAQRESLDSINQ